VKAKITAGISAMQIITAHKT